MTVGGTSNNDAQTGIFMPSNQAETKTFPRTHGSCTEYCGRIYEATLRTDNVFSRPYSWSTNIGCERTSYTSMQSSWPSVCSPYNTYDFSDLTSEIKRDAACSSGDRAHYCPLGWGNVFAYGRYEPGCRNGSRYPSPTSSYVDLSDIIGSLS